MAINTTSLTQSEYEAKLYEFIKFVEESGNERLTVYNDGKGFATIGVGFNLHEQSVLTAVLEGLGLSTLDAENQAAYMIQNILPTVINTSSSNMQSVLNAEWERYTGIQGATFQFPDIQTIRTVFENISTSYETTVDNRLANSGVTVGLSNERIALMSLEYNGILDSSPSLRTALANGNRFEAWFQIRYNSNLNNESGIAKRRVLEAGLFGLFSSTTPSDAEAENAVSGFIQHLNKIQQVETDHPAAVANAQRDYATLVSTYNIDVAAVGQIFKPITQYILNRFNVTDPSLAQTIDGDVLLGIVDASGAISGTTANDLLVSVNDTASTLIGGDGNDVLIGNVGNDELFGGLGRNLLVGGGGFDKYYVASGDDVIRDNDGSGEIIADGVNLSGDYIVINDSQFQKAGTNVTLTLDQNSNLLISDALSGGGDFTVENFDSGNLGITLDFIEDEDESVEGYRDSLVKGNLLDNSIAFGNNVEISSVEVGATQYATGSSFTIQGVGSFIVEANGDFLFQPSEGFSGNVPSITYNITGPMGSDQSSISINVKDESDPSDNTNGPLGGVAGAENASDSQIRKALESLSKILSSGATLTGSSILNARDLFQSATEAVIQRRDPLILDLDGDGIELSDVNGSDTRFDLDANGFAETTAWVSPDDGLLVLDRNGNGVIDDGTELFGDQTPISGGIASSGFAALSDLDLNADGVIDASDQQFSEIRIWQDINQDGLSDDSELFSLQEIGISSINLNPSESNQVVNGNSIIRTSSYTRSDGATGEIGDISLQSNALNSTYVGDYQLTLEALLSPLARGYGNVADLHIAASQNADLLALVQDFSNTDLENSSESLSSQVEAIIFEWAGTAGVDPDSRGTMFDSRKLEALEAFLATDFVNTMGNGMPMMANVADLDNAWNSLVGNVLATLAVQSFGGEIYGSASYSFSNDTVSFSEDIGAVVAKLKTNQPQDTSSAAAYWINNHRILTASADGFTSDVETAISDALEGTPLEVLIGQFGNEHISGSEVDDTLTSSGSIITAGAGNDILTGNNSAIIFGGEGNDTITSGSGNSVLDGGEGNDTLTGYYYGNNTLVGGAGDDTLKLSSTSSSSRYRSNTFEGGTGNDTLTGAASADTYLFNLGDGQDVISDNGQGLGQQDKIVLGAGIATSDVALTRDGVDLLINIGAGGDQITVKDWYSASQYRIENLEFADGTVWDVNTLESMGLVVQGTESDDMLAGLSSKNDEIHGLGGDDQINGNGGNDLLYGEAGNDTITSGSGNSVLDGGEGNDTLTGYYYGNNTLVGGAGDDTLKLSSTSSSSRYRSNTFEGGTGNDTLTGAASADTYLFNLGDGQDVISDNGQGLGQQDKIVLGAGIDHDDLWFTQAGNDLVIDYVGSDDRITVENWYSSSVYHVETMQAGDEVLLSNSVDQLVQAMAAINSGEPGSIDDLTAQQQDDLSSAIAAAWQTS